MFPTCFRHVSEMPSPALPRTYPRGPWPGDGRLVKECSQRRRANQEGTATYHARLLQTNNRTCLTCRFPRMFDLHSYSLVDACGCLVIRGQKDGKGERKRAQPIPLRVKKGGAPQLMCWLCPRTPQLMCWLCQRPCAHRPKAPGSELVREQAP